MNLEDHRTLTTKGMGNKCFMKEDEKWQSLKKCQMLYACYALY